MSSRPSRSSQPPPPSASSSRNNEYFVPRDGIDREVITADICRYLGQDALVRPGTYENPDGRVTQGYYVTAYRNLTSAMIQDLKADSARWEQERRAAARNAAGASSRSMPGSEYKDSTTHYNRQANGPSVANAPGGYSAARYDSDAMMVDAPAYPRYPGTGNGGYNGVNSSGYSTAPQGYGQGSFAPTASYAPQQASYAPTPSADRYATGFGSAVPAGQPLAAQQDYISGAQYSAAFPNPNVMNPGASAASRTAYPPGTQAVYAQDPYYASAGTPTNYQQLTQPIDGFYGRGPNAGNQAVPAQGYGNVPAESNLNGSTTPQQRIPSPTGGSQAQMTSSAAATLRDERSRDYERERDRDRERERDRERDRARHREDREDRHSDRHHRTHRTRQ